MLRIRTGYSFRSAAGHLEECVLRLQEIGASHAPITDRASTFGWTRWTSLCKRAGLIPCYGVELAVTPAIVEKERTPLDYWTFLAGDDVRPINDLVSLAAQQFYFVPRLTVEQAFLAASRGVAVVMGHRPQIDWETPVPGVHLALGPSTPKGLVRQAIANGWPLAATSDNRFPRMADKNLYEVIAGPRLKESQSYPQHILDEAEWRASIAHLDLAPEIVEAALATSRALLERSTATLLKASLPDPPRPAPLRDLCIAGAKELGVELTPAYAARLARELDVIEQKRFEDYFYIVGDLCRWARARMIVGPARGSSCGSLVCYLLGITTVDPMPHGLLFERFIDVNRADLPDIDIDFSDQQRHLVFEYLTDLYRPDHIARVGAVSMYKPKSIFGDLAPLLQIPKWQADAVAKAAPVRNAGDGRATRCLEDAFTETTAGKEILELYPEAAIGMRMEGHPRHYTQHAAGIVLAKEPVSQYVAIDHRTGAIHCDKDDAEKGFGLLKIDVLGLTTLSVFEDCLAAIGKTRKFLEEIPLDDPEAFNTLNDRRFCGIFQFTGDTARKLCKQIRVTEFNDLVALTALARPGPSASGGAEQWVRRRNGTDPVRYAHEIFEPFLSETLGVVTYQEQVMRIARELGDMSWPEVTEMRRAIGKSLGREALNQFGEPWKKALIGKGVPEDVVDRFWDDICGFGAYAFNKSHAYAYALISYWCMYLKAHYPVEFAAATLTHETDAAKQIQVLREMSDEGIDYTPFDAHLSTDKWTVGWKGGRKVLLGPLSVVHGVGPALMKQILSARRLGRPPPDKAAKLLTMGVTSIDTVWPIREAIRAVMPDPRERSITTPWTLIQDVEVSYESRDVMIMGVLIKMRLNDENEASRVLRRGHKIEGPDHTSLMLWIQDDTGTYRCKITHKKYREMAPAIERRGRVGKAIYAVKGTIIGHEGTDKRIDMLFVSGVRFIGDVADAKKMQIAEAQLKLRETGEIHDLVT